MAVIAYEMLLRSWISRILAKGSISGWCETLEFIFYSLTREDVHISDSLKIGCKTSANAQLKSVLWQETSETWQMTVRCPNEHLLKQRGAVFDLISKAQEGPALYFFLSDAECFLAFSEEDIFMNCLLTLETLGLELNNNGIIWKMLNVVNLWSIVEKCLCYKMAK